MCVWACVRECMGVSMSAGTFAHVPYAFQYKGLHVCVYRYIDTKKSALAYVLPAPTSVATLEISRDAC